MGAVLTVTKLLKPKEAAEMLNVSTRQVHYLFQEGELTGTYITERCVRIDQDSVEKMINRGRPDGAS